jgi:hypothetical protein
MSRSISALDHAPTSDDCDAAIAALDGLLDLDATVTIGPEENKRLLATAFALEPAPARPATDDEITIDARSPVVPIVARVSQRPPALKTLVLTSPPPPRLMSPSPAAGAPPISGWRPRVTPAIAKAARELRAAEDARGRPSVAASLAVLKANPQHLVVAGIWAMALSLMVTFAFILAT